MTEALDEVPHGPSALLFPGTSQVCLAGIQHTRLRAEHMGSRPFLGASLCTQAPVTFLDLQSCL